MSEKTKIIEPRLMKVAHDNGNGDSKIVTNKVLTIQPNIIHEKGFEKPQTDGWGIEKIKTLRNNLIIGIEEEVEDMFFGEGSTTEEAIYFVGKYALDSGLKTTGLNIDSANDKLTNKITIISTLGYIAAQAVSERVSELETELGKEFDITDIDSIGDLNILADLTTALPARIYSKAIADELANKFLEKEFNVNIYVPNNKFVKTTIKFDKVGVLAEGVTASYYLANANDEVFKEYNAKISENGTNDTPLTKDFFRDPKNTVLHIAIGAGTTEYPRTNVYSFEDQFKRGSNHGIGHAINDAIKVLENQEGTQSIRNNKSIEFLIKNKGIDPDGNKNPFFKEIVLALQTPLKIQVAGIMQNVIQELDRKSPSLIVVYGGGSILMRKELEKALQAEQKARRFKLLYIPEKYAVNLEAYGLNSLVYSPKFNGNESLRFK